jgi:hypothetical protein
MGIALKDYLNQNQMIAYLNLPEDCTTEVFANYLPSQLRDLEDLKLIVLTGLLWGYSCYLQAGLTEILPRYEARLLS